MKAYMMAICLLVCFGSFAQKHSLSVNYKPSLTTLGKQSQDFNYYSFTSGKGRSTFNSSFNLLYSYRLFSKFSLTTGIEYAQQGQVIRLYASQNISSFQYRDLDIELNYVRIPLQIGYTFMQHKNASLQVYSGVSFATAVKRKDNYQGVIPEQILLPEAEKRYHKTDWSIPLGLMYKKKICSRFFANLGAEYLAGLNNAFVKETGFGVKHEFDHSRQNRLALNIGLGMSFQK